MTVLTTLRLRLEPISDQHLDGLHAMNAQPEVMQYISGQGETLEQTAAFVARVKRGWAAWGTGWWAMIHLDSGRVAGAGCIQHLRRDATIPEDLSTLRHNPSEIGWRLHPDFWHQGLASEAASRMTAFAFEDLAAEELLAVRHPENLNSARVMDRLGMRYRGLETWYGRELATHVLRRADWSPLHRAAG